jgi:hypothetical protein
MKRAGKRALPWLLIALAVVAATSPAWRPLLFPTPLTIDDILSFRCG